MQRAAVGRPATTSAHVPRGIPVMPGLDGIRAFAVLAVVLYHAEVPWLPGGFLGVDVFFVLSGYLITSLLLHEFHRTGWVDLRAFWVRRVRRLTPMLLLTVGCTLLLAVAFAPSQLPALRTQAIAAVLNLANWHDITTGTSYFSEFGRPPLLRHLWSLSVEEQFYLVWPPILGLAAWWRGRAGIATAAAVIATLSVITMVALSGSVSPTRIYEGTDTRAATLLFGALLAVVWQPSNLSTRVGRGARPILDAGGVIAALVLVEMTRRLQDSSPSLGRGALLLASLAAVILIAVAAHPASRLGGLLGAAPLRWLGRRSYGIYLWHWPVIALTRSPNAAFGESAGLVLWQVLLSVGLAAVTFAAVEEPMRRQGIAAAVRSGIARIQVRQRVSARTAAIAAAAVLVAAPAWALTASATPKGGHPQAVASAHSPAAPSHPAPRTHGSAVPGAPPPRRPRPRTQAAGARAPQPSMWAASRTLFVGDSVILASKTALTAAIGGRKTFDAQVGRQPSAIVAQVSAIRAEHQLPSRVVVSLGDNGIVTPSLLAQLRTATEGVARVVVVTPRVPRSWGPPSVQAIRAAAAGWPSLRIADWDAVSENDNELFSDGVHPTPGAGAALYAHVVKAALTAR